MILAAFLTLLLAGSWRSGLPVYVNASAASTLPCLSYAPFRRAGSTPFTPEGAVTAAQIEADLALVKPLSLCVRTYGTAGGLEFVPDAARKLGMRVRQGAWLGRDELMNRVELDRAIALANSHPDVIEVLIVGNEVMLRNDLTVAQLAAHLRYAKAHTRMPISYADVWEFWRRFAVLQDEVDSIAIHVLPYWEDVPVSAEHAVDHVFSVTADMKKMLVGKPVWIGETGWPAAGRQRGAAIPSVLAQTQLIRELASRAPTEKVDINVIEAFDQPWKRALEGAMGSAWGVFTADGTQRVQMRGAAAADPTWRRVGWGAIGGLALSAAWLLLKRRFRGDQVELFGVATLSIGLALLGALLALHYEYLSLWSRTPREWGIALVVSAAVVLASIASLATLASFSTAVDALGRAPTLARDGWQVWTQRALLLTAGAWALILVADPRYRGFPLALFAAPAAFSACHILSGVPRNEKLHPASPETRFLAWALIAATLAMLAQEGLANGQACSLATMWSLLALSALLGVPARQRST